LMFNRNIRNYSLVLSAICLLLIIAIVTVGYYHFRNHKEVVTRDKYHELASIADLELELVVAWRKEYLKERLVFLTNPFFSEAVARFLSNPGSTALRDDILTWLSPLSGNRTFHSVVIFDGNLAERLTLGVSNTPVGKPTRDTVARALRSGTPIITDLHYGYAIPRVHLDVVIPLSLNREAGEERIGVVLVRVDPSPELFARIESWPTPSRSAEVYLARREGSEVVYLNTLRHRKGAPLSVRLPITERTLPAVNAALGYEGAFQCIDYRGLPVFTATRKVPGSDWFLVAKIDTDEILSPLRREAWIAVIGSALLILAAGACVGVIWRHAYSRYYLRLYREERGRRVLAESVERLGRLYHTQSHVNKAVVRCREKLELFEEVCRCIVDDGGFLMAWIGIVGQPGALIRPAAFFGHTEGYLDKITISADSVPTGLGPVGRAVREGRHAVCQDIEYDLSMRPWREEALRRGYRSSAAFPLFVDRDCVGSLNVYASETNFFVGEIVELLDEIAADISFALASMEQSKLLRVNEKRFQQISEIMSDFAFSCLQQSDGSFRIDWMSGAVEEISGYSVEEINEIGCWGFLVLEEDRPLFTEKLIELAPGESSVCELRIRAKDGTIRWLFSSCRCLVEDDSLTRRLFGGCRDTTERKRAQDLICLNEARLQSLYNISQYRAASVQDLLDFSLAEALRLTASKFGYIYFYDEEKRQFILNSWSNEVMKECSVMEPQATYELDKTGIWGEAVRQRRPILVNDFQGCNPLKKGYPPGHVELFSYLTIPVFFDEKIVAVVGVANKGGAYDESDVRQLTLLSDSVWKYVERKRAEEELVKFNMMLEERILERTADLEAFSYTVSHDLRAPLRAISGFSGILLEEHAGSLDAEGRRLLGVIIANTKRMGQLIDDLLAFSRVGRSEINRSDIDMAALVRGVIDEILTGEAP